MRSEYRGYAFEIEEETDYKIFDVYVTLDKPYFKRCASKDMAIITAQALIDNYIASLR